MFLVYIVWFVLELFEVVDGFVRDHGCDDAGVVWTANGIWGDARESMLCVRECWFAVSRRRRHVITRRSVRLPHWILHVVCMQLQTCNLQYSQDPLLALANLHITYPATVHCWINLRKMVIDHCGLRP